MLCTLEGSVSEGKVIYAKACQQCHPYSMNFAGSKTSKEWKALFKRQEESTHLARIHLDSEKAKLAWDYFKNDTYKKEAKHLRDYLLKYSSDRAQHNSCY